MPNTIIHKLSNASGVIPDLTDLDLGEFAINSADGKAFIKQSENGVETIIEIGKSGGEYSQLELLTQNSQTGWRLLNRDPINYGDIGEGAVDFSASTVQSTVNGATGENSFAQGENVTAQGLGSFACGNSTTETVVLRDAVTPPVQTTLQFLFTQNNNTTIPVPNETFYIYDNSQASPVDSGNGDSYPDPSLALFQGVTDLSGNVTMPLPEGLYLIVFPDLRERDTLRPFTLEEYTYGESGINIWVEGRTTLRNGDRIRVYNVDLPIADITFGYIRYGTNIILANNNVDVYTNFGQYVGGGTTDATGRLQVDLPQPADYLFKVYAPANTQSCPNAINGWSYDSVGLVFFNTIYVPNNGVLLQETILDMNCG